MVNTNFTVTAEGNAGSGATSLNGAIASIDVGGANAAINTHYTITFGNTINLTDGNLLAINLSSGSSLTIQGGSFQLNGEGNQRGFFVYSGAVDIHNLTIENTQAVGGNGGSGGGGGGAGLGGGLFVASAGSVVLDNVSFSGSKAIGGNGGTSFVNTTGNFAVPGGGGGMGGNGGNGTNGGFFNTIGGGGGGGLGLGANGGDGYGGAVGTGIVSGAGAGAAGQNGAAGATWGGGGGGGAHVVMTIASTPGMPTPGGGMSGGMTFQETYGSAGNGGGGGIGAVTTSRPNGGFGGGGGGAGFHTPGGGGTGGFGGGGGGGIYHGGDGGFGGGGGGFAAGAGGAPANTTAGGQAGFGGGDGGGGVGPSGTEIGGGGGGLGAGGDIFVQSGGSLTLEGGTLSGGVVTAGLGGTASGGAPVGGVGSAYGSGIFIQGNQTITFSPTSGQTTTVSDVIADMTGSHDASAETGQGNVVINGGGTVVFSAVNTYTGTTTISAATTFELANVAGAGTSEIVFQSGSTGVLRIDGTTMPTNPIDGFAEGDTIDLRGLAYTSGASESYNAITDTLTVTSNGVTETLTLTNVEGNIQAPVSDGASGTPGTEVFIPALPTVSSAIASSTATADLYAGHLVTITIDTNENMTVADGTTLSLSDGNTATYASGSGTSTLIFTLATSNVPAQVTITAIASGSIEDGSAQPLPIAGTTLPTFEIAVVDTAANVSANFDSLDTEKSYISTVSLTDGGTPDLDLTVAQFLNDTTLIAKIASAYNLVIADTAANVSASFDALDSDLAKISGIQFTDTGTPNLNLTAAQIVNDGSLIGEITGGYSLVLNDSAANIAAKFDALNNHAGSIYAVQLTGGNALDLTALQTVNDTAILELAAQNCQIVVNDSAADIAANFDTLNAAAQYISSVQFTDNGTPNLDLTADQIVGDQTLLGVLDNGSYNLVLKDSAGNIEANFDSLNPYASEISSVQVTGGDTLALTVEQILNDQSLISVIAPQDNAVFILKDGAATIGAEFASLNQYANEISSVQFTDGGTPNVDLTAAEILNDQTLIGKIAGSHDLVLKDSAAVIQSNFDALGGYASQLSSVQFTDGGTPNIDLTAAQVLGDQTLVGKLSGSYNLILNDSAANFEAHFASLESDTSEISSVTFTDSGKPFLALSAAEITDGWTLLTKITNVHHLVAYDTAAGLSAGFDALEAHVANICAFAFTDGGTPTLDLTATQVTNDATLLAKAYGAYDLSVTGVTAEPYTSYLSDYNSSEVLTQTTDFNTNGTETITGYVSGLTLTGGASGNTFYLQSAPSVTATGGAGNDTFFFGSGFSSGDQIDGGGGTNTLELDGTYTGTNDLAITSGMMTNIQTLYLAAGHSYDVTLDNGTVASGATLTVQAGTLASTTSLTIDGSALTASRLVINDGAGSDTLIGGAGNDAITAGNGTDFIAGHGGLDTLTAGTGADTFAYYAVSDSTSTAYDVISGFNTSGDTIDLLGSLSGVTAINTAVTVGTLGASNFDADLVTYINASHLSAHGAVLFTPTNGGLAGNTFLIIDENGVAGYQAGQDLVIELTHGVNLSSLSLSNFETAA